MNKILEILNSQSVLLFIIGLLIISFAKTITRVFRMGATFKVDLVTKKEQRDFEDEMRRDMRSYCNQIQDNVTKAALTIIQSKLADLESVKLTATEMKVLKAELETEIRVMMEKYDEIKVIGDNVRTLGNKISRLEYNAGTIETRRSEK